MSTPMNHYESTEMMEGLEAEFMDAVAAGDQKAITFAFNEADSVSMMAESIMRLLVLEAKPGPPAAQTLITIGLWAEGARKAFLEIVENDAAPSWAAREYEKRRQDAVEMQQEWNQSEWPELRC